MNNEFNTLRRSPCNLKLGQFANMQSSSTAESSTHKRKVTTAEKFQKTLTENDAEEEFDVRKKYNENKIVNKIMQKKNLMKIKN